MRRLASLSALVIAALFGCSSPATQSSGSPTGSPGVTIAGHSLVDADGVAVAAPGSAIPHVFAILGSRNNLCSLLQGASGSSAAGNQVANLTSLEFHLYDSRTSTVSPGAFPVPVGGTMGGGMTGPSQLEADVVFSVLGPACDMVVHQWASAGTVTVTSLQPTLSGSYDLTFGADHVTGSFDVNYCDGVHVQGTGGNVPPVCEP
jgi:hypothetical protein